jgi:hypothetical protein
VNEHIEFQQKLDNLDCQFNGQASKLANENPHMSLNKIEDYLLRKVCSEQTFSMLSASVESGVPGKL